MWRNFSFRPKSRWRFESPTWKDTRPWKVLIRMPLPLAHRTCLSKTLCREYLNRTLGLCLHPTGTLLRPRTTWISSWKASTKRQARQRCGWHHWNPRPWRNPMKSKKRFWIATFTVLHIGYDRTSDPAEVIIISSCCSWGLWPMCKGSLSQWKPPSCS